MEAGSRNRKVLGSWKEIAAYLGKGVRTVQRWENDLGLPVRRPNGAAKGVVYASPNELDGWLQMQWGRRSGGKIVGLVRNEEFNAALKASHELRIANQKLVDDLLKNLQSLRDQCAALAEATTKAKNSKKMLDRRGGRFLAKPNLK